MLLNCTHVNKPRTTKGSFYKPYERVVVLVLVLGIRKAHFDWTLSFTFCTLICIVVFMPQDFVPRTHVVACGNSCISFVCVPRGDCLSVSMENLCTLVSFTCQIEL